MATPMFARVTSLSEAGHAAGPVGELADNSIRQLSDEEKTRLILELQERVKQLQASDVRLRSVLDLSDDSYWEQDEHHRFTFLSEALERRIGAPQPGYLGKTRWELHPTGATPTEWAAHRAVIDAHLPYRDFEYVADFQGFGKFHVSISGDPVFGPDGRFRGYRGIVSDISRIKEWEIALRESEERFRLTFERAPVGVAHVGLDWRWIRVNEKMCELMGYSSDELANRTIADVAYPDDLEHNFRHRARLLAGSIDSYSLEKRYVRKDGTTFWGHLTVSVIRNGHGAPLHFVSIVNDISDRKAAEAALTNLTATLEQKVFERTRALRESEERTRQTADAGGVALLEWNRATDSGYWSDHAFISLGLAPGEVNPTFKLWTELVHPEDLPRMLKAFEHAWKTRSRFKEEYRVVWRNGSLHVHECQGEFIYNAKGNCTGGRGIWVDITDRKKSEEVRTERELQLRRALIRDVHHRIKNHQQGVAGLLHAIIKKRPDVKEAIAPAVTQMHALSIVHGMRGGSGESIAISELVGAIVGLTRTFAEGAVEIKTDTRLQSDACVIDDESVQLALVINELLVNAVKHAVPPTGTPLVSVLLTGGQDEICLEVTNPGSLPADIAERSAGQRGSGGLGIIRALLPPQGATLDLSASNGEVRTTLKIQAPLLTNAGHASKAGAAAT
jgi:PAS domain S-box-containing protein